MMRALSDFPKFLNSKYSALPIELTTPLVSENLLSPFEIQLPWDVLAQAKSFVKNLFSIRQSVAYLEYLKPQFDNLGLKDPGNKSILMSYDFHLTNDKVLKLIEINTNASFLAVGTLMYEFRELLNPIADFKLEEICSNLISELSLNQPQKPELKRIAIIDDQPSQQKLFVEFLLFNEVFKKFGFDSRIQDFREPINGMDLVYNRSTDFYLADAAAAHLRQAFLDRSVCFSPNPFEYFMLADKQRMIDWWSPQFTANLKSEEKNLEVLFRHLPKAVELNPENAAEIWGGRKNWFFKPKRSFGAKQSYRAGSISRRLFDEITNQGFLAQELVSPPEIIFQRPDQVKQAYKYDLRVYAYGDRVQSVVARIYQGQVTNLKTAFGGFSPVIFS